MSERPVSSDRPQVVTVAAILLFIAGGLGILGGLLAFGAAGQLGGGIVVVALINLIIGAAAIYAGIQILNLREQGRMIGLAVAGIGLVFALIYLIAYQQWLQLIGVLLYGFVLYALWTNAQYFRR